MQQNRVKRPRLCIPIHSYQAMVVTGCDSGPPARGAPNATLFVLACSQDHLYPFLDQVMMSDDPEYSLYDTLCRSGFTNTIPGPPLAKDATPEARVAYRQRTNFKRRLEAAVVDYDHAEVRVAYVPMKQGQVVLWLKGLPHGVTGSKAGYRTVAYMHVTPEADITDLPDAAAVDARTSRIQGKMVNLAIDGVLARKEAQWGRNKETIEPCHWNKFARCPANPQPPAHIPMGAPLTPTMRSLVRQGYAVVDVDPHVCRMMHDHIVHITRTVLFDTDRPGVDAALCIEASQLSDEAFLEDLFAREPKHVSTSMQDMRYFKRNAWDVYTGGKMRQGVQGLTNTSGMLDVFESPVLANGMAAFHETLRQALMWERLYFPSSSERVCIRGKGSLGLGWHTDGDMREARMHL